MGHGGVAAGKLPSLAGEQAAQKVDAQVREEKAKLDSMRLIGAVQVDINKQAEKVSALEKRAYKLRNPQEFEKYGGTRKWRMLGSEETTGFVYDQQPLFVHSSNLAMAQFFIEDKKMMVEFHGGGVYLVSPISEQEAIEFAQAPSKGGWYWNNVRIRGSQGKKGSKPRHKKTVVKIR